MTKYQSGVVVIGRNEGGRLSQSLKAAKKFSSPVVYVDSQSSDDSVKIASDLGIPVLVLDNSRPINASRGRNEGLAYLLKRHPELSYVHFIDGDSVFNSHWPGYALKYLEKESDTAVICGLLREKDHDKSLYARLLNIEWLLMTQCNGQCGGNATIRVDALNLVNGYDESLIAGADPDLYRRLKMKGLETKTIDHEMAEHDARMLHFSQWWTRNKRAGYAFADASSCSKSRHGVRSALIWGLIIPATILILIVLWGYYGLVALIVYVLQAIRIVTSNTIDCLSFPDKVYYALNVQAAKLPQVIGVFKRYYDSVTKVNKKVIHYKDKTSEVSKSIK